MLVVFYIKLWLWNLKLIILLVKLILHRFLGKGKIQMDIAQVVLDKFSNNETTVRLGEPVRNQDIFIIQTGASSSPSPSSLKRCHRRGELQRCHRRASSSHQCLQACLCRVNHGCNLLIINTSIFSQCNWNNLFFPISVFPIWYSILLRLSPPTSHTPNFPYSISIFLFFSGCHPLLPILQRRPKVLSTLTNLQQADCKYAQEVGPSSPIFDKWQFKGIRLWK